MIVVNERWEDGKIGLALLVVPARVLIHSPTPGLFSSPLPPPPKAPPPLCIARRITPQERHPHVDMNITQCAGECTSAVEHRS